MAYENIPALSIVDYVVFILSIVVSLGIGIYQAFHGGAQKTTSEYIVGGRKMKILPVAMSLIASYESSILMLGFPAEVFLYGIQFLLASVAFALSSAFAVLLFVPMLHAVKLTSVFEYIERRFQSTNARVMGCILQSIGTLSYMGVVLFGPAIALEAVVGFPVYASIIGVAVIGVTYTSVGGIKAVVWTDFFQCVVMLAGILAVVIKGTMATGGFTEMLRPNFESGRMDISFGVDPRMRMTFWTMAILTVIRGLGLSFNQTSFQRISATPTVSAAKWIFLISVPGFLIMGILVCFEGLVAYAYFNKVGCDPIKSGRLKNPNQVVILLVLELFVDYPGVSGLFLAALFSASLSTLSSGMGSVSAIFWEDIIKPRIRPVSEARATLIAKLAVVGCGVISVAISMAIAEVGGSLVEISGVILGAIGAPLTGFYFCAALFPSVHSRGMMIATVIGFVAVCWVSFNRIAVKDQLPSQRLPPAAIDKCMFPIGNGVVVSNATGNYSVQEVTPAPTYDSIDVNPLYTLSPYIYSPFAVIFTIIIALLISHIMGHRKHEKVDRSLVTHLYRNFTSSYFSRYLTKSASYNNIQPSISIYHNGVLITQKYGEEPSIEMEVVQRTKPNKNGKGVKEYTDHVETTELDGS